MSSRTKSLYFAVGVCAMASVMAACSSAAGGTKGGSGSVKIAVLASTPSQDSFASPGQVEGAQLAVDELNAHGGISGRKVELVQYRMPQDANVAASNMLTAASGNPVAMVGLPLSSTAKTLAAKVARLGIPFIYFNAVPDAYRQAKNGSPMSFMMRSDNSATMDAGLSSYLTQHKVGRAGLVCLTTATGGELCDGAAKALAAASVPVVSRQKVGVADKDFTSQALAMKGADLVVTALTPAQVPTVTLTLKQNGMSPLVFGSAVIAAMPKGSLPTAVLPKVSGVVDCVPSSPTAPAPVKSWASKFKAQYGFTPDFFGAESYDSIMLVAQAAKVAGSTDHAKVADALRTMPAYQGICSVYKANDQQILNGQSILATYDAQGVLQVGEAVTVK